MSRPKTPSRPQPKLKQAMDTLIRLASDGRLEEAHFQEFRDRFQTVSFFHTRKRFAEEVSEPLFTVEWMDSMARLLKGYRVVEILSYRGVLIQPMSQRGIEWVGADEHPKLIDHGSHTHTPLSIHQLDPRQAIETLNPDVVVMPRLRKQDDDSEVLGLMAEHKLPLVLLRDSGLEWGRDLWTAVKQEPFHVKGALPHQLTVALSQQRPGFYYLYEARQCFPWFQDVPNWHDGDVRTWFALPAGAGLVVEGQVVAGPPVENR